MTVKIEVVAGEEIRICMETEEAIYNSRHPVYISGGSLVVAIDGDSMSRRNDPKAKSARLVPITKHRMRELMAQTCTFGHREQNKDGKWVFEPHNVPVSIAEMILARVGNWPFEEICGLSCCQSIDASGSIIDREGVHRESGLLFRNLPKLPPMPERPSRDDALAALDVFRDLLAEFPFTDPPGKGGQSLAVAIAMIITALARAAFTKAPMVLVRAPTAGTGKSFLCRIVAAILLGKAPAIVPFTSDEEEFEKKLTGVLLQGSPLTIFDNVNGTLKSSLLCQALTEEEFDIRPLGTTNLSRTKVRSIYVANGNNVSAALDLLRRCLLTILDRNEERPELHEFKRNPLAEVMADRGRFIAAGLTILKAYADAGRPPPLHDEASDTWKPLPPLASYEAWSSVVRDAIVWLGMRDPVGSMEEIRSDDEGQAKIQALVDVWPCVDIAYTVGELLKEAKGYKAADVEVPANDELQEALVDVAGDKIGEINTKSLGRYLLSYVDRVFTRNGKSVKVVRAGNKARASWCLKSI